MITIEHLQVEFEAERQRDEVRFAQLFAQHMASHDDQQQRTAQQEAQARRERAVPEARSSW